MGDYRNELQSALSQVEALRSENASLRLKLRASQGTDAPPPVDGHARPGGAPSPNVAGSRRQRVLVGACVVIGAVAVMTFVTLRGAPAEERLLLPNLPEVPAAAGPARPLPLPPTSVRLPLSRDEQEVVEVREPFEVPAPAAMAQLSSQRLRWPRDTLQGLYVLHTTQAARCSVGGVLFDAPSAVFVTAGAHTVRCQVGNLRHVWEVTIVGRGVTLDTRHDVGSP
jgi:hypothetical protein